MRRLSQAELVSRLRGTREERESILRPTTNWEAAGHVAKVAGYSLLDNASGLAHNTMTWNRGTDEEKEALKNKMWGAYDKGGGGLSGAWEFGKQAFDNTPDSNSGVIKKAISEVKSFAIDDQINFREKQELGVGEGALGETLAEMATFALPYSFGTKVKVAGKVLTDFGGHMRRTNAAFDAMRNSKNVIKAAKIAEGKAKDILSPLASNLGVGKSLMKSGSTFVSTSVKKPKLWDAIGKDALENAATGALVEGAWSKAIGRSDEEAATNAALGGGVMFAGTPLVGMAKKGTRAWKAGEDSLLDGYKAVTGLGKKLKQKGESITFIKDASAWTKAEDNALGWALAKGKSVKNSFDSTKGELSDYLTKVKNDMTYDDVISFYTKASKELSPGGQVRSVKLGRELKAKAAEYDSVEEFSDYLGKHVFPGVDNPFSVFENIKNMSPKIVKDMWEKTKSGVTRGAKKGFSVAKSSAPVKIATKVAKFAAADVTGLVTHTKTGRALAAPVNKVVDGVSTFVKENPDHPLVIGYKTSAEAVTKGAAATYKYLKEFEIDKLVKDSVELAKYIDEKSPHSLTEAVLRTEGGAEALIDAIKKSERYPQKTIDRMSRELEKFAKAQKPNIQKMGDSLSSIYKSSTKKAGRAIDRLLPEKNVADLSPKEFRTAQARLRLQKAKERKKRWENASDEQKKKAAEDREKKASDRKKKTVADSRRERIYSVGGVTPVRLKKSAVSKYNSDSFSINTETNKIVLGKGKDRLEIPAKDVAYATPKSFVNSMTKPVRGVVQKIVDGIPGLKIVTVADDMVKVPQGPFNAVYVGSDKCIILSKNGKIPDHSKLHELIHASTEKALANPVFVRRAIKIKSELIEYMDKHKMDKNIYALSDSAGRVDEFIAEAFSNPKIMRMLNDIPSDIAGFRGEKTSLWDKLINELFKMFGVKLNENSAMKGLVDLLGEGNVGKSKRGSFDIHGHKPTTHERGAYIDVKVDKGEPIAGVKGVRLPGVRVFRETFNDNFGRKYFKRWLNNVMGKNTDEMANIKVNDSAAFTTKDVKVVDKYIDSMMKSYDNFLENFKTFGKSEGKHSGTQSLISDLETANLKSEFKAGVINKIAKLSTNKKIRNHFERVGKSLDEENKIAKSFVPDKDKMRELTDAKYLENDLYIPKGYTTKYVAKEREAFDVWKRKNKTYEKSNGKMTFFDENFGSKSEEERVSLLLRDAKASIKDNKLRAMRAYEKMEAWNKTTGRDIDIMSLESQSRNRDDFTVYRHQIERMTDVYQLENGKINSREFSNREFRRLEEAEAETPILNFNKRYNDVKEFEEAVQSLREKYEAIGMSNKMEDVYIKPVDGSTKSGPRSMELSEKSRALIMKKRKSKMEAYKAYERGDPDILRTGNDSKIGNPVLSPFEKRKFDNFVRNGEMSLENLIDEYIPVVHPLYRSEAIKTAVAKNNIAVYESVAKRMGLSAARNRKPKIKYTKDVLDVRSSQSQNAAILMGSLGGDGKSSFAEKIFRSKDGKTKDLRLLIGERMSTNFKKSHPNDTALHNLTKKEVKSSYMITGYDGGKKVVVDAILADTENFGFLRGDRARAEVFYDTFYAAMKEEAPELLKEMNIFKTISMEKSRIGKSKTWKYKMPDGFEVSWDAERVEGFQVLGAKNDDYKGKINFKTDFPDIKAGLMPHVYHSVDAYVMREMKRRLHIDTKHDAWISNFDDLKRSSVEPALIESTYREVLKKINKENILNHIFSQMDDIGKMKDHFKDRKPLDETYFSNNKDLLGVERKRGDIEHAESQGVRVHKKMTEREVAEEKMTDLDIRNFPQHSYIDAMVDQGVQTKGLNKLFTKDSPHERMFALALKLRKQCSTNLELRWKEILDIEKY